MKKSWLEYVFGCSHKWVTKHVFPLTDGNTGKNQGFFYVLKCSKCGDVKKKQLVFNYWE